MILSAGLSPAWQQILVLDHFQSGEVNRAREAVWCGSGKVLNVAVAVHLLGGPGMVLAPLGGPPLEPIDRELGELGMARRWIVTRAATRVCTTILDRGAGTATELVENGRPMDPDELDAFRLAFAEEAARAKLVVLSGSLPTAAPPDFYRGLLRSTSCPTVLDFRGEALLAALDCGPYVVKPNRQELSETLRQPLDDDRRLLDAMRTLNARGAAWVVVTQGAGPVWLTSRDRTYRFAPPPFGRVINSIGSGDALAAGLAWATHRGDDIVQSLRVGLAAAAENLERLLPGRLDPGRIATRAADVRVEELSCGR